MWARYVGHKLHVKGLASVAQLRKRPTSASQAERELRKLATSGLCSRENRSQINCTIAMKFKTHTPSPNAIMNRSMNRPRIHTSRVDGLSFGAFVSMRASVRCIGLRYDVLVSQATRCGGIVVDHGNWSCSCARARGPVREAA